MILLFIIGLLIVQVYSASSSCTGPIHIKSQSDLDSIRSCQEIDGSVYIQNITTDSVLNLSQLQHVRGDLIISGNHDVSQVVLASLQQVDGQLKLQDNSGLNRLDLTQLTFTQSMELSVDPLLDTIRFPSGLSQIESLTITDTGAEKIEGLTMSKIKHVNIANNAHLTDINLNHLQSVGGVLSIAANSPNLTLDLSMLSEIYQGDFRNLANLTLNKVHKVTGDLSFISNGFQSLALPNITDMTGALSITDNQQLFNLSVPTLKHLGGALSLANNTKLTSIQVPKLEQVDGTIDLTGSFEKLDLPGLINVQGGFNAQTSSNSFSCDDVNKLKGGVTKGHEFTCKSNVSNPQSGISGTSTHRNGMDSGSSRVSTDKTMFIIIIPFISFFL